MYDVNKLQEWKAKVQQQIDAVVEANLKNLSEIIRSEIKPTDRLTSGMGIATLMDSKGRCYLTERECTDQCHSFIEELNNMQYQDYFECDTILFKDIRYPIKKKS